MVIAAFRYINIVQVYVSRKSFDGNVQSAIVPAKMKAISHLSALKTILNCYNLRGVELDADIIINQLFSGDLVKLIMESSRLERRAWI